MSVSVQEQREAIHVHVDNASDMQSAKPADRHTTFFTFNGDPDSTDTQYGRLLNHAPKRYQATITFMGQSTDYAFLCGDRGDAQSLSGAMIMGGMVIQVNSSDEIWVGLPAGSDVKFGVVAEFES